MGDEIKWVSESSLDENNQLVYNIYAEIRTRVRIKSAIPTSKRKNVWYHKEEWIIAKDIRNPFTGKPSYEYAQFISFALNTFSAMRELIRYVDWRVPEDEKEILFPFQYGKRILRQMSETEKVITSQRPDLSGLFDSSKSDNIGIESDIGEQ